MRRRLASRAQAKTTARASINRSPGLHGLSNSSWRSTSWLRHGRKKARDGSEGRGRAPPAAHRQSVPYLQHRSRNERSSPRSRHSFPRQSMLNLRPWPLPLPVVLRVPTAQGRAFPQPASLSVRTRLRSGPCAAAHGPCMRAKEICPSGIARVLNVSLPAVYEGKGSRNAAKSVRACSRGASGRGDRPPALDERQGQKGNPRPSRAPWTLDLR